MYGPMLPRNPTGGVNGGLGQTIPNGTVGLMLPTDTIKATGETRTIDGVQLVFQATPGTEAPAEMNTWFPQFKAFWAAENMNDEAVTAAVRDFYERYPYPPPIESLDNYRLRWQDPNRRRADFHLHWPDKPYSEERTVLVAGCGTSQAAKHDHRRGLAPDAAAATAGQHPATPDSLCQGALAFRLGPTHGGLPGHDVFAQRCFAGHCCRLDGPLPLHTRAGFVRRSPGHRPQSLADPRPNPGLRALQDFR